MDRPQFDDYFHSVLTTRVPEEPRQKIQQYWRRFGAKPILHTDDATIDNLFGRNTRVAAVCGEFCKHVFAFRPFLLLYAPELVLRTVTQHELIHCFLHSDETPAQVMERLGLERSSIRPLDPISSTLERIQNISNYNAEEARVTAQNSLWGGNDRDAWEWCERHFASRTKSSLPL